MLAPLRADIRRSVSPRVSQVADMQVQLAEESVFVEKKKKETDELIVVVGQVSVPSV